MKKKSREKQKNYVKSFSGGYKLKKTFSIMILLLIVLSVNYVKDTIIESVDDSPQKVGRFFDKEGIYETAHEKYGVYSMGVDQKDKLLLVSLNVSNYVYKEDVEKYFEQQLFIHGLKEYSIEVYFYENGNR